MQDPKNPRHGAAISQSPADNLVPGVIVEFDPAEADRLGAFVEDAIDEDTAWAANIDL